MLKIDFDQNTESSTHFYRLNQFYEFSSSSSNLLAFISIKKIRIEKIAVDHKILIPNQFFIIFDFHLPKETSRFKEWRFVEFQLNEMSSDVCHMCEVRTYVSECVRVWMCVYVRIVCMALWLLSCLQVICVYFYYFNASQKHSQTIKFFVQFFLFPFPPNNERKIVLRKCATKYE